MSMSGAEPLDVLVDGQPARSVAVLDRGLHYGDGVFETIAIRDGVAPLRERHWQRLQDGCRRLGIPAPRGEVLGEELGRLAGGAARAVVKVIVTRGSGGRGYSPPQDVRPTRILLRYGWPQIAATHWSDGIAVRFCDTTLGRNPQLAGIKHLNRIEQVLARREWQDPAIAEGLMCDEQGRVIEATACNVFMLTQGALLTPDLSACGVAGVMRALVLELAAQAGLETRIEALGREQLLAADSVFLTNSLVGIWPVRRIGEQRFAIEDTVRELATQVERVLRGA